MKLKGKMLNDNPTVFYTFFDARRHSML